MKKRFIVLICMILAALTISSFASTIVSPALNILAKDNSMIKSGLVYNDVYFSKQDFMKCLGITDVESVTVKELPEATNGVLKLGTLNVTEGQIISSEYLSVVRFVPANEKITGASFVFECEGTEVPCIVKYLDEVNFAPAFAKDENKIKTYCNVSCYGNINTEDPEGDITDVQIVMYPEHGTISITDPNRGSFKYTPSSGFVGEDEFAVVARDIYGNYSEVQTVKVGVEKNSVFFSDAVGHWSENAAICLYKAGAIDVISYNEEKVFCPNENISREEFVTMTMKALNVSTLTDSNTSFADNSLIDVKYRPYIATAQRMGYINGKEIDGVAYFDPKGNISKAEAAIMINNILGLEDDGFIFTFADDSAIPVWAKSAIYALTSAGIFNGDEEGSISPSAILTRAQSVQMLYNTIEY